MIMMMMIIIIIISGVFLGFQKRRGQYLSLPSRPPSFSLPFLPFPLPLEVGPLKFS